MSSNIEQVRRRACWDNQRLTQSSLIALMSNTGTVNFLLQMNRADWEITSFDANTREVCVSIMTPSGNRVVSMIIPPVT